MYTKGEKVVPVYIEEEMKESYISYAMSVIVGRALPDIRDGLKPVHRRILYTMHELNLRHNQAHKKSARIVGDCLGKYHPHGDMAVYDALVRMTQDFSLRYPLIDGQGNFGCFTKDTMARLSDGRSLNFEELIKESEQGKRNYTFSFNANTKRIEIAEIKNPRKTRKNTQIIKVILDNGEKIKCTPDHLFMLRDGTYKKAKDLNLEDSLMPLYTKFYDGKDNLNLKGYEVVYQPLVDEWEFTHYLADKWNLENKIYKKSAGRIRHHKDFNKLNNNPDNIQRVQWNQHWKFHKEIASQRHKEDLDYVKKIAEGRKRFWADPENRRQASLRWKTFNFKNWRKHTYRKKMSEVIRKAWQRPEYRKIIIEASSKNLKELWQREDFKELLSKLKSKELKKRWKDPIYRDFIAEMTRKTSFKIWSNPEHRKLMSQLSKQRWCDAKYRQRITDNIKILWQGQEFRSRYSSQHFRNMAKKLWQNPLTKEFHREKAKRQWENEEFRINFIKGVIRGNQERLKKNPNLMDELNQKARIALEKRWRDPLYKERVLKAKILSYVSNLLKANKKVTPEIYESQRTSGLPKVNTALNYFSDFEELISQAKEKYNHKIVNVEVIDEKEDVYDLTIEPWHNFALASGVFVHNSVDGDVAAAMRYTEARMAAISDEMLADIEKDTVNFSPNFDGSLTEPVLLPAAIPNLLINGSSGIAVGMATNIPPHNLGEVIDGAIYLIDHPDCEIKALMKFIKAPDFPTGGIICGRSGIKDAYAKGRGRLVVRARAQVEKRKGGKDAIVVTELPFQVNKANLISSIAELVVQKRIEGVADIRDESDREGMRIVIDLKRDVENQIVLNQLFKRTELETTFGIIFLALVDNRPRVLNLKQALHFFLAHRKEIIKRRTQFELDKALNRAHILEGLKICLKFLDRVIKTIKQSKNVADAKTGLMKNFKLSDEQSQAILEMQLQRLTALERSKIEAEYLELIKRIEVLRSILASGKRVEALIKDELTSLKKKYADERRTDIVGEAEELDIEDLIAEEDVVITVSHAGYIKRLPVSAYHKQHRGGKGVTGAELKEQDFIEHLFVASTHEYILFFTDTGRVFWLRVHEVPQAGRASKGKAIINLLQLKSGENISACIPVKEFSEDRFLVMATKNGLIKKTRLDAYSNPRKGGIIGLSLEKGDRLISVKLTDGKAEILLATREGKAVRFLEKQVRDTGRAAKGVKGISLSKKDNVIAMEIPTKDATFLTVTENGFAKRTTAKEYRLQSRGGKGIINIKVTSKNGSAVNLLSVSDKDEIMSITQNGMIVRCAVKDIRATGRAAQGVRLIKLDAKDKVACMAPVVARGEE